MVDFRLKPGTLDRFRRLIVENARASVRGLQGNVEGAAAELKRALAIDPTFRFHAASDSDFDAVRDVAAFIDVIEPSHAGA